MKNRISLFLSSLLLSTTVYASAKPGLFPPIKGASPSTSASVSGPNSPANISQGSAPVLPLRERSDTQAAGMISIQTGNISPFTSSETDYSIGNASFNSVATTPHAVKDPKEQIAMLLQTAKQFALQAKQATDPIEKANLHKQSSMKFAEITQHRLSDANMEICLKQSALQLISAAYALNSANPRQPNPEVPKLFAKAAKCYEGLEFFGKAADAFSNAAVATSDLTQKMHLFQKALDNYQKAGDTGNAQLMQIKLESIETHLNDRAQQLIAAAQESIQQADSITAKEGQKVTIFTEQGHNIATPKAAGLKLQAAAYYKEAGDIFAANNKPRDAAVCYENSAAQNCHASQKVELLKLSAQQHSLANNPTKSQDVQKAAERQEKSLTAHREKMAARSERKRLESPEFKPE